MAPASVATPLPASATSCTDPEGAGHSQPGTATGKHRPIPPAVRRAPLPHHGTGADICPVMPVIPAYRPVHAGGPIMAASSAPGPPSHPRAGW
ncbi:hypothetical protein V499_09191 [Pseudogymnoascus sp. VKM F-103]|nr:hypothetical protein V499_09191 [Pseudogymnoascus sp. VKM F-103]